LIYNDARTLYLLVCIHFSRAGSLLPGLLLHLTKRGGVVPDFSYDKGDDGITDNNAGWLKQFSSSPPPPPHLLNSRIAAREISKNFWIRLLESCWAWFVFFLNILYQPAKEYAILVAVHHQGIPHCQWRKASLMSTGIHCSD